MRALTLAALALASCYSPTIKDDQYQCMTSTDCPSGFHCNSCSQCVLLAEPLTCSQFSPCTNGDKQRAAGDPNLPNVAFCPGAWQVGGVSTPAKCGNAPAPDGSDGKGGSCSIADNCMAGWHPCTDGELGVQGLTTDQCKALPSFFAANQVGVVPKINGTPTCAAASAGAHYVFGCGPTSVGLDAACTTLSRAVRSNVVNVNCPSYFNCADPAGDHLTKASATDPGGVMCCKG